MQLTQSLRVSVARARVPWIQGGLQLQRTLLFRHNANRAILRSLSTSITLTPDTSQVISQHVHHHANTSQPEVILQTPIETSFASAPAAKVELPLTCSGCGALSQENAPGEAGFYSRSRRAVKVYLREQLHQSQRVKDLSQANPSPYAQVAEDQDGIEKIASFEAVEKIHDGTLEIDRQSIKLPVCDRCHDLVYNSKGQSIAHPSIQDIADSITESPFKKNHVYHILDAADFPMSLFPKVFQSLELAKPRSQNRRSQHKFSTKPSVSFIITRSDLLAPAKEMVDRMLPYFQDVLRLGLGKIGRDLRLGNVHLVSAKRGWWTTDIKNAIWERGGGNWMVGRVNVGKSNLFEVLFPKGSGDRAPVYAELQQQHQGSNAGSVSENAMNQLEAQHDMLPEDSLLPPAQPEVPFPAMPIVSSLPGTTASPIRLPFGNHRGELIDLPGLERGNLEQYVQDDHKLDLVMQHRPNVKQHTIKAGQSLLLGGGLVRITPQLDEDDASMTMQAYPFVPIEAHVTSTEKAIGSQSQLRESGIRSILAEGSGDDMASAGEFKLSTDVTKLRAGPLVRAGVPVSKLPFKVYSTDILIEGVGWVELVCQVRKKRQQNMISVFDIEPAQNPVLSDNRQASQNSGTTLEVEESFKPFALQSAADSSGAKTSSVGKASDIPQVEIFSPHGKHIAQRKPLGAWILWDEGRKRQARSSLSGSSSSSSSSSASRGRPRRPMAGSKKKAKMASRAETS